MRVFLFTLLSCAAASVLHHAPCPPDAIVGGLPWVQCNRSPPCVRWNWATPERCARLRLDHEWPTYDPYVRRNHSWTSARDLFHNHLRDKTLTLVGDSINNLWFHAILCEAARNGLEIQPPARIVDTNTTILQMGWGKPSRADTAGYLAASDVLIVNYGLHYHNETEYEKDMHRVLADLGEFNKHPGKLALFRETSAQAFAKTGAYAGVTTMGCAPTPPETAHDNLVYRQNEFIRRAAPTYGVSVLPFYEETLPRWNVREEKFCETEARQHHPGAECTDCTHLCYTPTFWAERVHALAEHIAQSHVTV